LRFLVKTFLLPVACLLLISCGGSDEVEQSGRFDNDACDVFGTKIINGTTCDIAGSSIVVVVTAKGRCTGFVAGQRQVVTAAHCFCDPGSSCSTSARVVVEGREEISSESIVFHPDYRVAPDSRSRIGVVLLNDVAVINLSSSVLVSPLAIKRSAGLIPGTIVGIFGYGRDEDGKNGFVGSSYSSSDQYRLQSGEMEVSAVSGGIIEAFFSGDGSNTCDGDSGGPMTFGSGDSLAVVGVTSTGLRKGGKLCSPGEVSVFTDLTSDDVYDFLAQNVQGLRTR